MICCFSFITCSRRLVAVEDKSLFCPFSSATRVSNREIRSSFRERHFCAATRFLARFLSSLIRSWDSMLIGDRGGEELRQGTVWGSSSSLGRRMSTTGADWCTCEVSPGFEWATRPAADDTGREAPVEVKFTPLGREVVVVTCWSDDSSGSVALSVAVELGGYSWGWPMGWLVVLVTTALASDGWAGSRVWLGFDSFDWSCAKASTKPLAYASCSSVTNFGKMNCVGVGVVTTPLVAWMIIFSNSGDASFNMCKSGDCKRAAVFFAFELEPLKSRVIVRLSRLTADSGPEFESNIDCSILTEGTRRSSLKGGVGMLPLKLEVSQFDDSQGYPVTCTIARKRQRPKEQCQVWNWRTSRTCVVWLMLLNIEWHHWAGLWLARNDIIHRDVIFLPTATLIGQDINVVIIALNVTHLSAEYTSTSFSTCVPWKNK